MIMFRLAVCHITLFLTIKSNIQKVLRLRIASELQSEMKLKTSIPRHQQVQHTEEKRGNNDICQVGMLEHLLAVSQLSSS